MTCARDSGPQECYLGPKYIFHKHSQYQTVLGPKNSCWGSKLALDVKVILSPPCIFH
jgi:hypothetical protein